MLSKLNEKDRNVLTVLRHAIEKHEKQATNKYEQNNEQILKDDNKNEPVKQQQDIQKSGLPTKQISKKCPSSNISN